MSLPLSAGLVADAGLPVTPVLSPDGRRIGYGRQPGGTLHVVTVGGPTRTVGEGRTPRWSADSRHLFFLAGGELWRERADGGDRTSWPVAARDFVPLADLATVVVLSPDPGEPDPWVWSEAAGHDRLRLLDLRDGTVTTPDVFSGRHVAEVAERPGGGPLAVLTQESADPDPGELAPRLHLFHPATGQVHDLGRTAAAAHSLTWWAAADGWHLLYLATTPPGLAGGNAVLDVALTGEHACPTPVSRGSNPAHRNLTEGLPFCPVDLAGGGLMLAAHGLDSALHRLDPATGRFTELRRLRGQAVRLSAAADGATVALARSEAHEPRSVFAGPAEPTGPADGPLVRQSDTAPELRAVAWGRQERLAYRAADGLNLDGLLVLPPGKTRADGPFSLVTFLHGGPYGRWADQLLLQTHEPAQWLAADGHAVFLPNPRGGQGHGHAFAAAGTVGQEEWQDVLTGLDLLIEQGVADPGRLGIGWEGAGPHPHDERSPISYAARITTPVLIVHGAEDANVPLGQAVFLHRALRRFGVEHEFVVYPREGHTIAERAHRVDLLRRTREWFRRLNPGRS
ncbi:prolyl oligopeptidase family serine peptidase [Nonomuraea sp. NPDC050310]|uniref:S9 family peptidase n=1 Tax=Nonomuraea sp. NPDC050310 TaxID=3154935 RepID=UPI0033CF04A1